MPKSLRLDRCSNPFDLKDHFKKKSLRRPTNAQILLAPSLTKKDSWLCSQCRDKCAKLKRQPVLIVDTAESCDPSTSSGINNQNRYIIDESVDYSDETTSQSVSEDQQTISSDGLLRCSQFSQESLETSLPPVNKALQILGHSPIPRKKAKRNQNWVQTKMANVNKSMKRSLGVTSEYCCQKAQDFDEIMKQLKEKFHDDNITVGMQIQILSTLPKSWTIQKIVQEMDTTRYMARKAKMLVGETGIFSVPDPKLGAPISTDVLNSVLKFYEDDEVSVMMPGKKDFVSMKDESQNTIHKQKRLLLCNLRELYQRFKQMNPEAKIGCSKFISLRPKNCVFAGASGTHTVCVCSTHQNIKLMISGGNLPTMTKDLDHPITNWEDVLLYMTCDDAQPNCLVGRCEECPKTRTLEEVLYQVLTTNNVKDITYKQWVMKERMTFDTQNGISVREFVKNFGNQAKLLIPHAFIAKQQAQFLKDTKLNLKDTECVVVCDFAENYAFVIQDAAPGFHWNNNQATVYPVVIYYKQDDILEHRSMVIVSNCLHHDAVAVYAFSEIINDYLKELVSNLTKVIYFSDGAPQQYKNFKNFSNIYFHEQDFGVAAEWHFFATSHGKGPCDGVGGTFKRIAARASLQLSPENQITTPEELFEWASKSLNLPKIRVFYSDVQAYNNASEMLSKRLDNAKKIPQTQSLHCFIPKNNGKVFVKQYSAAAEYKVHSILKVNDTL